MGEETVAKMDQIQAENDELKLTIQNLVLLLREESNRCKKYSKDQIEVLKDLHKFMKMIDSDNEGEDELDTIESITEKYKNINTKVAELNQYQTKYHQITQITNRASIKAGGIEKYDHAQFGSDQAMYFEDKSKNQSM